MPIIGREATKLGFGLQINLFDRRGDAEGREIDIRTLAPPFLDEILQSAFRIHPQPNLFVVRSGRKLHGARTIVDHQNSVIPEAAEEAARPTSFTQWNAASLLR